VSARFYKVVRLIGSRIFWNASAPRILHAERAAREGAYLLAANHLSPYDAPLLIATTPRVIYWLSIVEIFRNPLVGWFLRGVGAEPLDRGKVDTHTVRAIVRHLRNGEVVGIFPEGGVRSGTSSVLDGGDIHEGIGKLAHLAQVPVVPCVVLGGSKFSRWTCWLPGARTRWAVAYGEPIFPRGMRDRTEACNAMAAEITSAMRMLQAEVADYV
jgi:1-acyl-sn-glycerol-3-phosphate acyltransferase